MIDLYFWPTGNGKKISIMLEECGLPYRVIPVNINKGDQSTPEYLAINPNGKMPAIVDHEAPGRPLVIFESGAILQYLGEKSGRFLPQDLHGRYRVLQWVYWQVAGLGPNAGTLALALHTAGVLGRLFAEALENTPKAPAEAIRLQGGSQLAAFCYGTLPNLFPQLLAYSLYRWENNIRMASVLGFVGAGGLGQMLYVSLSLFQEAQASTVILAMLVLVFAVDALSGWTRQRWVRA